MPRPANQKNEKFFLNKVKDGSIIVLKCGIIYNCITHRLLNYVATTGYITVAWKDKGKVRHILGHRLVFLVHGGPLEPLEQVNHIDGIKTHNNIKNLERCTNAENTQHAYDTGLNRVTKAQALEISRRQTGHRSSSAAFNPEQIKQIRIFGSSKVFPHWKIAKAYKVHRATITDIINYRTYAF